MVTKCSVCLVFLPPFFPFVFPFHFFHHHQSIHPLLVRSLHYCPKTKAEYPRSYQDESTSLGRSSLRTQYFPTKDVDGNVLEPEFGYFEYRDHQTAVVQEMPEYAPAGQLPRSVPVVLDDDLADQVKPGDRVQVVGVYRAVPGSALGRGGRGGGGGGILAFRTVLVATNVRKVMRDASAVVFSGQDLENILAVRELPDVYERMAASLAPSIFGHDAVKKALLLQLLGGQEKRTQSGIHLRGDIHLLLVGDPSTAKSQLLRFMLHVAPLAVSTNARGASGVGLTAAVVADPDTHERALEAGAMVLADRGVVCIDEFDKMSVDDRAALHEVMEQQTITIQKAGVHASLNARCSVFAAANPIYGSYNRDKNVMQNIGFPSTLLSRFDALFVILDPADARRDRAIAQHVLRMHREGRHVPLAVAASGSRAAAASGGGGSGDSGTAAGRLFGGAPAVDLEETMRLAAAASSTDDGADVAATPVFAGTVSGGSGSGGVMSAERIAEILAADPRARFSVDFIRKYVSYARLKVNPAMTMEAGTVLVEAYADFRQRSRPQPGGGGGYHHHHQATLPITARMLESMVRLSEAHARCRLAPTVTVDDANAAVALLRFALYSEGDGSPEAAAPPVPAAGDGAPPGDRRQRHGSSDKKRKTKRRRAAGEEGESAATATRRCVQELFGDYEMVTLEKILDSVGDRFPRQQVEDALLAMHNDGLLLYTDGVAYRT